MGSELIQRFVKELEIAKNKGMNPKAVYFSEENKHSVIYYFNEISSVKISNYDESIELWIHSIKIFFSKLIEKDSFVFDFITDKNTEEIKEIKANIEKSLQILSRFLGNKETVENSCKKVQSLTEQDFKEMFGELL